MTKEESISKSMSEMFRQHDYRTMYEFYLSHIRPSLREVEELKDKVKELLLFCDKNGEIKNGFMVEDIVKELRELTKSNPL